MTTRLGGGFAAKDSNDVLQALFDDNCPLHDVYSKSFFEQQKFISYKVGALVMGKWETIYVVKTGNSWIYPGYTKTAYKEPPW